MRIGVEEFSVNVAKNGVHLDELLNTFLTHFYGKKRWEWVAVAMVMIPAITIVSSQLDNNLQNNGFSSTSHREEVVTDGETLSRRMGKESYSFEKNFLRKSMQQAFQVKKQRKLKFVTPILAFSEAQVSLPPGKVKGVYVVEKLRLVPLLKSLG